MSKVFPVRIFHRTVSDTVYACTVEVGTLYIADGYKDIWVDFSLKESWTQWQEKTYYTVKYCMRYFLIWYRIM